MELKRFGNWSRRFAIFATLIFVVLFAMPFPLWDVPFTGTLGDWWNQLTEQVTPWVAEHVLRLGYDVRHPTGGGEPTKEYIRAGTALVLAIVAAGAWALLDRGRTNVRKVDQWLRLYLRLFLVSELFSYGLGKVLPNQFGPLGPERLMQTFGETTPSSFLWAFMGYSVPYTVFAGLGETLAGVLLCFHRTTTLGALIGIGVMSNVVMLNFAYDVGVKLHASFILFGLVYLVGPDVRRLFDMLVLNRATVPRAWEPLFTNRWRNRLVVGASGALCAGLFVSNLRYNVKYYRTDDRQAPQPPLYGLYDVESVRRNGVVQSNIPVDSTNWYRVGIGMSGSAIRLASGSFGLYGVAVDTTAKTVRFRSRDDPNTVFALNYVRPDTGHLVLRGISGGDSVEMVLVRRDEMQYRLMQTRFRWAQDGRMKK